MLGQAREASIATTPCMSTVPALTHRGRVTIEAEYESQLCIGFARGFSIEVKQLVADGPTVMVERVDRFNLGGKTYAMEVAAVFEIDDNGLIKRCRDYYDAKSIEDQVTAG